MVPCLRAQGSVWEFGWEGKGGLEKKGRKKWKEWRALGGEGFEGLSFLHNTKSP